MAVGVAQLDVEGLQAPQHSRADPPRGNGAYGHALEVVGPRYAIGDVPAVLHDPSVGGDVVPHQRQDDHDHMFGDTDAVAVRHLCDGDAVIDRSLEGDVVGADPRRDREFQLRRLRDPLGRQVRGPKRLRYDDVGVNQLAFEHGVGAVLVRGNDQRMTLLFQESAQAKLSRNATQELARVEIDTSVWAGFD